MKSTSLVLLLLLEPYYPPFGRTFSILGVDQNRHFFLVGGSGLFFLGGINHYLAVESNRKLVNSAQIDVRSNRILVNVAQ